jgi:hypothetical protein
MRTMLVTAAGLAAATTLALTPSAATAAGTTAPGPAGAPAVSTGISPGVSPGTATAARAGTAGGIGGQELRFWGYWQNKNSSWAFATVGPAQAKPANGTVQGWRYARSSGASGVPPRARPDFEEICGSERAEQGRKRIAVVIDYGERSDAPPGQSQGPPAAKTDCAVVDSAATGADVLAAVARPQSDAKGLICAIDAYPAGACGPAAAAPGAGATGPPSRTAGDSGAGGSGGPSLNLVAGVVVVLAVAAAGAWFAVRRRRTPGAPGK